MAGTRHSSSSARAPRSLWKGAISFGLIHIPVSLHTATSDRAIDFDWLDKRSLDPVGYRRINRRTGREIPREQIVKGVEVTDGRDVVLSDEEIKAAYPKTTRTIEIGRFVSTAAIPFVQLERPSYLAPVAKGEKVYALLRETLLRKQRVRLARVVIQSREHLAALVAVGPVLVLHLLRWGTDVRGRDDLPLPAAGTGALGAKELQMAGRLVDDLSGDDDPTACRDAFQDRVMALVRRKAKAGKVEAVEEAPPADAGESGGDSNVIDLTGLLKRSLQGGARRAA